MPVVEDFFLQRVQQQASPQFDEANPQAHKIEIIEWVEKTIEMPDRHCLYTWTDKIVKIKFRYQRDFIMARLRW